MVHVAETSGQAVEICNGQIQLVKGPTAVVLCLLTSLIIEINLQSFDHHHRQDHEQIARWKVFRTLVPEKLTGSTWLVHIVR